MMENARLLMIGTVFICLTASASASDAAWADKRCKCICPRVNGTGRAVYIQGVTPEQCNCDHVVLPSLPNITDAGEFCARCQCKHENRNSVTIQAVVILFVVITGLLLVYMVYLLIEARLCKGSKAMAEDNDRNSSVSYEQHLDEEDYTTRDATSDRDHHGGRSLSGRLNAQMTKWKKAVMQQRGNVYVRRTVLNN